MSLFKCTAAGAAKRRLADRPNASQPSGTQTPEEIQTTLRLLEARTKVIGQVTLIHDARIRELETLLHTVQLPVDGVYGKNLTEADKEWKGKRTNYYAAKKQGSEVATNVGSKHLTIAAVLLNIVHQDPQTTQTVKDRLSARWVDANTETTDFLTDDVRIAKWRVTRDGKSGILEFRLTDELADVEAEIKRVLIANGGRVKNGPAPRGSKVRELDEMMEGTWTK